MPTTAFPTLHMPLPPEAIQEAIQACVAECQIHPQPLACLAGFMEQLRADPAWTETEIVQVETATRRILARLFGGDE